jgi:hypothetical protein
MEDIKEIFGKLSLYEQKQLLMELTDIHKLKFDSVLKEVLIYSSLKDISKKIKDETGFDCRWIYDSDHSIGTNVITVPKEMWSMDLEIKLKKRYDLNGDNSVLICEIINLKNFNKNNGKASTN